MQAPLKERYTSEPGAALVTLSASGSLGDGVSCSVQTGRALATAGLHPATGGDGALLCSGDMLLRRSWPVPGATLQAVATSLEIPVASGHVHAEGELDFRGTLGVDREAPVGFSLHPALLRARDRRRRRAARDAEEAHRALLRGAADAGRRAGARDRAGGAA